MAATLYLSKLNVNGHEYQIKDANAASGTDLQDLADNLADGLATKVGYAIYDERVKSIIFYDNSDNRTELFKINATDFIKDGMVSNVEISEGNLVITFNTDAGKEPISIALTDIFNPANYYNKTEVDSKLDLKADASNVYTKSEADGKFLTEHQSLADYPTIETMNTALGQKANVSDIYTQTEINNKLALKANSADLATVATSGSYNDLSDKPVIPEGAVVDAALSDTSENPVQNKVVKGAIDAKQDVISDLETIRSGAALGATALQSYTETDPVFTASAAHGITSKDITAWNAKSDFSGSYNDLRDKPTLTTVSVRDETLFITTPEFE